MLSHVCHEFLHRGQIDDTQYNLILYVYGYDIKINKRDGDHDHIPSILYIYPWVMYHYKDFSKPILYYKDEDVKIRLYKIL